MSRSWPLVALAALVVLLVPLAGLWYATRQWSGQVELDRAHLMAVTVLERTESISRQTVAAAKRLDAARGASPCSPANIALMRDIDLTSSYLQAVGYVDGDALRCSSFGRHDPPIALGPPRYVSSLGVQMRPAERLSLTPGRSRVVAVRGHSAVLLAPELITDLFANVAGTSVGVFSTSTGVPIAARGTFAPRWRTRLGHAATATFADGPRIVALQRSAAYDLTAYAAIPADEGRLRATALAVRLLPLALLVGVVSSIAVLWIAREQRAFPSVIRAALRRDEFFLVYQPIVALGTGRWTGAEALLRWRRHDGAMMRPDVFIPAAEDNGLIERVTARVLELLARDVPAILAARPDFRFSVNLSHTDLVTPEIVPRLQALLADSGLSPTRLTIEATERGVMEKDAATDVLRGIRALGIRVAIDDFGTGYANLAYLHSFEVDAIKIDKSFVDTIGTTAVTAHVAQLIIDMGRTLSLDLVAEGVEHARQAEYLRDHGVQHAQGWLFAMAMPAAALQSALAAAHDGGVYDVATDDPPWPLGAADAPSDA